MRQDRKLGRSLKKTEGDGGKFQSMQRETQLCMIHMVRKNETGSKTRLAALKNARGNDFTSNTLNCFLGTLFSWHHVLIDVISWYFIEL